MYLKMYVGSLKHPCPEADTDITFALRIGDCHRNSPMCSRTKPGWGTRSPLEAAD